MIYDEAHINLVREVNLDSGGYYQVELPAVTYIVDINYIQYDWSNSVP